MPWILAISINTNVILKILEKQEYDLKYVYMYKSTDGHKSHIVDKISSWNYGYEQRSVDNAKNITKMVLLKQLSQSSCTEGCSYGFSETSYWVNFGCRAIFKIYYSYG